MSSFKDIRDAMKIRSGLSKDPEERALELEIIKLRRENEELGRQWVPFADLNTKGMALEKAGKIEEAIAVYEENIKSKLKAGYPYDRLIILYRRLKRWDDMLRVTNITIDVFGPTEYHQKRIAEAQTNLNPKL